jgi:hypothetical protein
MGSSSSKRRKDHEHPHHLPKVGTPANRQWEQETRRRETFGSGARMVLIVVLLLVALLGWLLLTA